MAESVILKEKVPDALGNFCTPGLSIKAKLKSPAVWQASTFAADKKIMENSWVDESLVSGMSDKRGTCFFRESNLIESHQGWHSARKANAITKIGARPLVLSAMVNTRTRLLDKERKWIALRRSEREPSSLSSCLSRRWRRRDTEDLFHQQIKSLTQQPEPPPLFVHRGLYCLLAECGAKLNKNFHKTLLI